MSRWLPYLLMIAGGLILLQDRRTDDDRPPTPDPDAAVIVARDAITAYSRGLSAAAAGVADQLRAGQIASDVDLLAAFNDATGRARRDAFQPVHTHTQQAIGDEFTAAAAADLFDAYARGWGDNDAAE
jgi:hypothetical protein